MTDADISNAVRAVIPNTVALYLFGSQANDTANAESDLDLAILAEHPLAPMARFDAQEAIAARLHINVDLVDLMRASSVLRVQIVTHGRVLLDRDPNLRARFEMTTLSMYARLNEERRGILADVRARGNVYG